MIDGLNEAISRLNRELPGWWWSIGYCSVSADASIGPDVAGPDYALLEAHLFDSGFHADLRQPATVAEALNNCINQAIEAKRNHVQS